MASKLSFKIKPRPNNVREQLGYNYLCKSFDFMPSDRRHLNSLGYEIYNRADRTVWYRMKPKPVHFKPRRVISRPISKIERARMIRNDMQDFSKTLAFKFMVMTIFFAVWVIGLYTGITIIWAKPVNIDDMKQVSGAVSMTRNVDVLSAEIAPQASQVVSNKILQKFGPFGQQMLICMQSENSRLDPKAPFNWNNNGTQDYGLMRINSIHCASHGLKQGPECQKFFEDVDNNINEAKRIFDSRKYPFTAWYGQTCRQFWNLKT